MAVSLTKGSNFSLTRTDPGLASVVVGLGWKVNTGPGDVDLDASALVLGADGRVLSDQHFVFFNNRSTPEASVRHTGDNKTGEGEGDDEQIAVDFNLLPPLAESVVVVVSIHNHGGPAITFGRIRDAYIRVVHQATGVEMCRYELTEDAHDQTAMVFGQLYRREGEWKFRAIGQGYATGLAGIAKDYGVNV
ncbi:TerD family protein [Streptomyces sparsogenes]|uniref:Stress protein n=1 Tax=Streptomyces sparsogenes DSM 40356 TaxID=1331668 RepID=A0A1R1SEE4_9ACTN|nr:TerD family protein [Streptomyces sparsogenes]OMI36754.1 stress protein [Streptomyces sparsogenes DSM 40356]